MRPVLPFAAIGLAVSCSGSSYALPDRTDDQVRATEGHLSQVVSAARGGGDCDVRFVGDAGGSAFVWAACFGSSGSISAPMRIEGDDVELPGDGSQYSEDVRGLFPSELADVILTDQERLRP